MLFSSSMKILVTASSFPADSKDWRAVFIRQLVDALGRRPELDLTLWAPPGETGPGVRHDLQGDDATWLASLMADGGIAHLLRTQPVKGIRTGIGLLRRLRAAYRRNGQTDLYHVNWLQNALALPHDGKPLLVTVLGSDLALLRLPPVRMAARRLLDKRPAVVCPNAAWMLEPLRALLGSKADIREVPFGIDAYWYQISRLPSSGAPQRWLAVTRLTRGKLGTLFEWAAPCFSDGRRELHLFGPMQEEVKVPAWVHYHGPATPQQPRTSYTGQCLIGDDHRLVAGRGHLGTPPASRLGRVGAQILEAGAQRGHEVAETVARLRPAMRRLDPLQQAQAHLGAGGGGAAAVEGGDECLVDVA